MSKRTRVTRQMSAALTGAIAFAIAAGTAMAGYDSTPNDPAFAPAPRTEAVQATSWLVCDGGFSRTIQGGINVEDVDEDITGWAGAYGSPDVTFVPQGEAAGSPLTFDGALPSDALGSTTMGTPELAGTFDVAGGIVAGASTHSAVAGDMRGIATNPCQWPTNTVWLVGGSSEVGSSLELTVTNPGGTQVSVAANVFSSRGKLDLGANSMLHLAPGASETVLLDGLIAEDPRIALHLFSDTGPFTASLQTSSLDGVTPAGIDMITTSDFGTDLVIPGLVIDAEDGDGEGSLPDPNTAALLRVVNPSEETATVEISVRSADGAEPLPGGSDVAVAAGSVLDLSLDGLAPGSFAIDVNADLDVSAGLSVIRTDEAGRDIAWLPAQRPITNGGSVAIGPRDARLIFVGTSDVTWTSYSESGEQLSKKDVTINGVATIDVPAQAAYVVVAAESEVYGSVWISDDNGITAVPFTQDFSTSQGVTLTVLN